MSRARFLNNHKFTNIKQELESYLVFNLELIENQVLKWRKLMKDEDVRRMEGDDEQKEKESSAFMHRKFEGGSGVM